MSLVSSDTCLLSLVKIALLFQLIFMLVSLIVFSIQVTFDDYIFCFGNFCTAVCNVPQDVFHLTKQLLTFSFAGTGAESSETEVHKLFPRCTSLYQPDLL